VKVEESSAETDPDIRDLRELTAEARVGTLRAMKRAMIPIAVFGFCSFITFLFTDAGPLHRYWVPLGAASLLITAVPFLATVFFVGLAWSTWSSERKVNRYLKQLVEDRYGVEEA